MRPVLTLGACVLLAMVAAVSCGATPSNPPRPWVDGAGTFLGWLGNTPVYRVTDTAYHSVCYVTGSAMSCRQMEATP